MFWTPKERLPPGTAGVPIGSPIHIIWLLSAFLFFLIFCGAFSRMSGKGRKKTLRLLSGLCLFLLLMRLFLYLISGVFQPSVSLPLHLCDLMVFWEFSAAFLPYDKARFLFPLCWWAGLPGALFALVTPGETLYPFWNIYYLIFILLHCLLFLFPLCLFLDGFRPRLRQLPGCFLTLLLLAGLAEIGNRLFGGNYFFLHQAPAGSILVSLQRAAGPCYFPAFLGLVPIIWGVMQLVYFLFGKLKKAIVKERFKKEGGRL